VLTFDTITIVRFAAGTRGGGEKENHPPYKTTTPSLELDKNEDI